jgi:hypothetical protein
MLTLITHNGYAGTTLYPHLACHWYAINRLDVAVTVRTVIFAKAVIVDYDSVTWLSLASTYTGAYRDSVRRFVQLQRRVVAGLEADLSVHVE